MKKLTLSNIKSYLQGNFRYYIGAPKHIQEQYKYRLSLCKDDCIKEGKCKYCGCPPDKKALVDESCNDGERFPDLLGKDEWKWFKEDNKIDMDG